MKVSENSTQKRRSQAVHQDLTRDRWHGGQLLAFSAIDGSTDYDAGIVARTSFDTPGIDVKLPSTCQVRFSIPTQSETAIASDCFSVQNKQTTITGVFLDA
ncbi:MAG: hypothetical protein JW936_01970, partial [Sedimentisphaerales bacterium]|nr:hypothetical protein [Sedimentisphaerales bacterium]